MGAGEPEGERLQSSLRTCYQFLAPGFHTVYDTMTASINELTRYGVIPLKQNYAVKVTECEGLQKNVHLLGCAKSLLITSHLAPDHSMHLTRERLALHTPKGPCKEEKR